MSIKLGFLILTILLVAIFVSILKTALNTSNDRNNVFVANASLVRSDQIRPGASIDNLFYFVHLSDIHLSVHFDKARLADLERFCQDLLPHLQAPVLVLTGDITDSRTKDPMGSRPYLQEWEDYRHIHTTCMKHNPSISWLDIRGNHDNFNVLGTKNAYYKNYTVQGNMTKDATSYRYEHKALDGSRYSFIGIDPCLDPGIRRPFNFIGQFYPKELDKIKKLKRESVGTNYTVWFGHYPTSSIINAEDIRPLINGPYLCGHYHNLHGLARQMISTQPDGYLEAEVADWKDNRIFRIAAIDHGLFTFEDFAYKADHEGPLVVITNPRKVVYQMEHLEPYWRTAQSTHIRALVFAKTSLASVKVFITREAKVNDKTIVFSSEMTQVDANHSLWVVPWNASDYSTGIYYVTVEASDNHHSTKRVTNAFSLDQTKPEFTFGGRMIIRIPFAYYGMFLYILGIVMSLVPLVSFRLFTSYDFAYNRRMFNLSKRFFTRKIVFQFYLLSHIDLMYYPLVFFPIYLTFGPWILGHYVIDHLGVSFIWGTIVNWKYLPTGFTYLYAAIVIIMLHIPFLLAISELVHNRYLQALKQKQQRKASISKCASVCNYFNLLKVLLGLIVIMMALASTLYYFAYGYLALIFNVYAFTSLLYLAIISIGIRLEASHFPISKGNDIAQSTHQLLPRRAKQHSSSYK